MFMDVRLHKWLYSAEYSGNHIEDCGDINRAATAVQYHQNMASANSWSGDGNPTLRFILSLARILAAALWRRPITAAPEKSALISTGGISLSFAFLCVLARKLCLPT
jgi:hypothetical protein